MSWFLICCTCARSPGLSAFSHRNCLMVPILICLTAWAPRFFLQMHAMIDPTHLSICVMVRLVAFARIHILHVLWTFCNFKQMVSLAACHCHASHCPLWAAFHCDTDGLQVQCNFYFFKLRSFSLLTMII